MVSKETRAHIEILLVKYLDGKATTAERELLSGYLKEEKDDAAWEEVIEELMMAEPEMESYHREAFDPIIQELILQNRKGKVISIRRKVYRLVAVAAMIAVVAMGIWLGVRNENKIEVAKLPQEQRFKNDVQPAPGQVTLTLADGSTIAVDEAKNGTVTSQGGTNVTKQGDKVVYDGKGAQVAYNTIATQKGKVFSLELADGTKVWLDAMSSITFPTSFPGNDRVVTVTGQAYFEVAHDAAKPFKVKSKNQTIEVLGTHFNINAHGYEVTTLLEGSVEVKSQMSKVKIKPGEQSIITGGNFKVTNEINLDEVMAWKNGKFDFENANINDIMMQLERWYDIDVEFTEKVPHQFVAKIPKDVPLSEILKVLELTNRVHFVIDGKKVKVLN